MKKLPPWLIFIIVIATAVAVKLFIFSPSSEKEAGSKTKDDKAMPTLVDVFIVESSQVDSVLDGHGKFISSQGFGTHEFSTIGKIGSFNQVELASEIAGRIVSIHIEEGDTVRKGDLLVQINDAEIKAQLLKLNAQITLTKKKIERAKKLLEVKGMSEEEFEVLESDLAVLSAEEAFQQTQLLKTKILAPFNGVVGLRRLSEGSMIGPSTPIVSIIQLHPVFVEFDMPVNLLPAVKKQTKVQFYVKDEMSGSAQVYAIEPKVDENTGTVKVRAKINGSGNFLPGSFVTLRVGLGGKGHEIFIPTQSILMSMQGSKVMKVKQGKAIETPVITGMRKSGLVEIVEGVSVGDSIIISGLMALKPGSLIKSNQPR